MIHRRTDSGQAARWFIPAANLARDRAGIVALTLIAVGLPARAWTVITMPSGALYATFPRWAQALVMVTLAVQLGAEAWAGGHGRRVAALGAAASSGMAAALFLSGDPTSGGFPTWAAFASMQVLVITLLSRRIGRAEG